MALLFVPVGFLLGFSWGWFFAYVLFSIFASAVAFPMNAAYRKLGIKK